jgi:hypothetical protein
MSAVVIDTNVLLVADGRGTQMSVKCVEECLNRLEQVMATQRVALDDGRRILGEYGHKLSTRSPTSGSVFLKWLLQREWNPTHVTQTRITELNENEFAEFPPDEALKDFHPADRKFIAVANAHLEKPPVLQAGDAKWLRFEEAFKAHGIRLEVLCRSELEDIRKRKTTGRK